MDWPIRALQWSSNFPGVAQAMKKISDRKITRVIKPLYGSVPAVCKAIVVGAYRAFFVRENPASPIPFATFCPEIC